MLVGVMGLGRTGRTRGRLAKSKRRLISGVRSSVARAATQLGKGWTAGAAGAVIAALSGASACSLDARSPGVESSSLRGSDAVGAAPDAGTGAGAASRPPATGSPDAASASPATSGSEAQGTGPAQAPPAMPGEMPTTPDPAAQPVVPAAPVTLTIVGDGAAFGVVSSNPPGLRCSAPPCSATFPSGTAVSLSATVDAASGLGVSAWSGPGCSGLEGCNSLLTQDTTISVSFAPANRVFVTSVSRAGDLGGLTGADALCQQQANLANLGGGNFIAFLPTDTTNAYDRLAGSRGWARTDGRLVFDTVVNDYATGTTNAMFYPIRVDERGNDVGSLLVHTGSWIDGNAFPGETTCGNWTSASTDLHSMGDSAAQGQGFNSVGASSCSQPAPLLCFEVGRNVAVKPTPVAGRVAFLGSTHALGGGLVAADARCQSEAAGVGLAGSFKALLASSTASAESRFNLSGSPWVRADGIRIAPTPRAFFESQLLEAAPNVSADGRSYDEGDGIWGGAVSATVAGTAASTCNDWTSTTEQGLNGRSGYSTSDSFYFSVVPDIDCSFAAARLICLQE
jgi:hypothetical protein